MIDTALSFLKDQLSRHMAHIWENDEPNAILSPLNPQSDAAQNKILLSLVNTSHDPMPGHGMQKTPIGGHLSVQEPLVLDLYLMVSAHYPDNYRTGLKALAHAITFFHDHPVFTQQTAPDLPDNVEEFTLQWFDLDPNDLHALWRAHGAIYRPSALFKVRGVALKHDAIISAAPVTSLEL